MRFSMCHSDRKYYAKGQCKSCYGVQRYGTLNSDRAKRYYHANKAMHQIKWLVPKFIYARNFKGISKTNYAAFLKYKNMLTTQFQRLHNAGYDKWLQTEIEVYKRDGGSYSLDLNTVHDILIKSTNDLSM